LSDHPVARWKLIFYILGAITIIWGFVLWFFLSDGPSNAVWLKAEDRPLAVARVAKNGTGIKTTNFNRRQGLSALWDIKSWMLSLAMFGSSVPNGVLTNFSGPIIKGLGFSTLNASLLDCAGRSLQVISLLIAGIIATKFKNSRMICVTAGNLICVLGSGLMAFLPHTKAYTWPRLVGFWLINCQSIGFTLGLVMISSNFGSYSKRSVTSTMVFICYCAGNAAGPSFVYEREAPGYSSAAIAMLGGYVGKTICHLVLWAYMWYDNKRRDRVYGEADPVIAADNGMKGMTEIENTHFRYVL
jgi:cyanate permease